MRLLAIVLSCVVATGCSTFSNITGQAELARGIDEDAVLLNEAHTRAINGILLQNILRARDHWPTGYTTLSGITNTPERSASGKLSLSPIGLGNPAGPFQGSSVEGSGVLKAQAQYSIQPFATGADSNSIYSSATGRQAFKRFWDAGWPREVLIPMFIESAKIDGNICHIDGDVDDTFARLMRGEATDSDEEYVACRKLTDVLQTPERGDGGSRGHVQGWIITH